MGSAASPHSRSSKSTSNNSSSRHVLVALTSAAALVLLLACRLTAGPPPRLTPTAPPVTPVSPQPTASPSAIRPTGSPAPSQTPVLPPSPSPAVTPASALPQALAIIRPENFARLRPLARFPSDPAEPLAAAGISPDGKSLAAITCYQKVLLWDLASGQTITGAAQTAPERCEADLQLAFSPGWPILATSGSLDYKGQHWGAVQIWRVPSAESLLASQILTVTAKTITSLAFSPDGRLLAVGTSEAEVKLWYVPAILEVPKLRSGEPARLAPLATLPHADRVLSLAFSPDGNALAAASAYPEGNALSPVLQLWDLTKLFTDGADSLTQTLTIPASFGPLWDVAFSPDGKLIAAAGAGMALWEAATGSPADQSAESFGALAFAPGGRGLAAGDAEQLSLWQVRSEPEITGKSARWLQDQLDISPIGGRIVSLSFSLDGRFLAILYEQGELDVWGVTP